MGRKYATELDELAATYDAVRTSPAEVLAPVCDLQQNLSGTPVVFVGSGGALAAATFAADLHSARTGGLAVAATPLHFVANLRNSGAAMVFFSARAKHPDVRIAASAARASGSGPVVLVTQLPENEVEPRLRSEVDTVVTIPKTTSDGFLATNSIVAMVATWLRASGADMPTVLPLLDDTPDADLRAGIDRVVLLHAPEHRAVAVDLETRLSETGVADVQVADLRNIAHGRHVGIHQRATTTAVLAISGPEARNLAAATREHLPTPAQWIQLETSLPFPLGALDCLAAGMKMFGRISNHHSVDPGRPPVTDEGRRLYKLPWAATYRQNGNRTAPLSAAVERKIRAAGGTAANAEMREFYQSAFATWSRAVEGRPVHAVALDYDGTCCTTAKRRDQPVAVIRQQVNRLLQAGITIGFASGRGKSLPTALRGWIPEKLWSNVVVGLYNGSVVQRLDVDDLPTSAGNESLQMAAELLEGAFSGSDWKITRVGSSRVDLQACKLEYSIVSPK